MALLDDVKKSLQSGFKLPQFGQSEQLREMQRATSGKLAAETGPGAASLAEQVAATAAEQQRQEDVLQGKIQAEQLSMQERQQQEEARQKSKQLDEQVLNAKQDMQNKVSNILQEYTQRSGEIDMREESAKTQFALTMMRLSNDDYLDQLEVEGARSRLQEEASFQWELTQSIFEEEIDILKNDLSFRSAMAGDDRAFKEYLAEMELSTALELSSLEILSSETLSKYEAYGEGVSAAIRGGIEAYSGLSSESEPSGGGTKTGFGGTSTRPGSRMTYGG
jgi:hypothetical protein